MAVHFLHKLAQLVTCIQHCTTLPACVYSSEYQGIYFVSPSVHNNILSTIYTYCPPRLKSKSVAMPYNGQIEMSDISYFMDDMHASRSLEPYGVCFVHKYDCLCVLQAGAGAFRALIRDTWILFAVRTI